MTMKLKASELIKNFPRSLRELAIQRAMESGKSREVALEKNVDSAFTWTSTEEGHEFWSDVNAGREFNLPEEREKEEKFKRGDIVECVGGYDRGIGGIYIGINRMDPKTSIIQRTDEEGWAYSGNASQFPFDFIAGPGALFWNVDTKHLEKKGKTAEKVRKFQMGDRVSISYAGYNGWFVCYTHTDSCIIEREDGQGWPRMANPHLVPSDYVCKKHNSFWAISEDNLIKIKEEKEEKPKFSVGDRVQATSPGWQDETGRVMKMGEKGIVQRVSGDKVYIQAETDGIIICRLDRYIEQILHLPTEFMVDNLSGAESEKVEGLPSMPVSWKESRPIGKGVYEQLREAHTFFYPSYPVGMSPYDVYGSSTSVIEKLPNAVLITKKKTKRRLI